jgi:hypothetical protein
MLRPTPLNDSLNHSKERWGMPVPVILTVFAVAGFFAWWKSALVGITLAVGIPMLSKTFISLDPQIYRLAALSLWQKAAYDPGRRK